MDVRVTGSAVRCIFEMMMLKIGDRVGHVALAGGKPVRPDYFFAAQYSSKAARLLKIPADNQFRSNRAGSQFRWRKIQIMLRLHFMIREFVPNHQSDATRFT